MAGYSSAVIARVSSRGYFGERVRPAPSVAEIAICETLSWFDSTNGASELVVKAKADDTVETGSIALA